MDKEMRAFLDYLCGRGASTRLTQAIDERINFAKNNKVWEIEYMHFIDYWEDVADDAREQGFAEGHAEGREQGLAEGRVEGRAEGRAEGENQLAELTKKLAEQGRVDDIIRAASDAEYRRQIYSEFGIETEDA